MSKLDNLYEMVARGVDQNFEEDGHIVPVWFLENDEGERIVVMTPIGSDKEKYLAVMAVKELMKKHNVVRYIVVLESWFVSRLDLNDERRPSECDDRMEAVVIAGEERDTDSKIFIMKKIDRSGEKPVLLDGDKSASNLGYGNFSNMFDKHETKH